MEATQGISGPDQPLPRESQATSDEPAAACLPASPAPAAGFTYVGLHDFAAIPAYLEAIAEGIRDRSMTLASGDEVFSAKPAELVRIRVEAGRSEEIVHVTVRLSWSEDPVAPESAPGLSIGSKRP